MSKNCCQNKFEIQPAIPILLGACLLIGSLILLDFPSKIYYIAMFVIGINLLVFGYRKNFRCKNK